MKPGHLAIICDLLDANDPVGAQSISLANELLQVDYDVSLIALTANETDLDPRVNLISAGPRPQRIWMAMPRYMRWVKKTLEEIKADETISMLSTVPGSIMVPVIGTLRARRRAALSLSNGSIDAIAQRIGQLRPSPVVMGWLERRAMSSELIKAHVALSTLIRQGLELDTKAGSTAIELARPSVDLESIDGVRAAELRGQLGRAFGINADSYWITFPFTDARLDGFEPMLRAFLPFIKQGVDSTLLLAGPTRYTHLAWLGQLGLRDRVRLIGKTPRLDELFAASDLVCNPTGYDPLGRVVLQAISAGKPIVTTVASGCADSAREGMDTVLQAPVDPQPLLDAVREQHGKWQQGGAAPTESSPEAVIEPSLGHVIDRLIRDQAA